MIDLRSDTVTRPSAAMREAMARTEVGDDVYGEDPAARRLEECAAAMLGKERAVFFPSGTQSNLAAALAHCGRGDEYLVGDCYHIYRCEAGGAAALGGISPFPLKTGEDGGLTAEQIAAAVKEDDSHFPRTALLCLENTVSGAAQDEKKMQAAVAAARERGLRAHLDGARLFNAAVEQDIAAKQLAAPFDSVSVCLSKGLGAPAGTMLCGEEAFCETARRLRKLWAAACAKSEFWRRRDCGLCKTTSPAFATTIGMRRHWRTAWRRLTALTARRFLSARI